MSSCSGRLAGTQAPHDTGAAAHEVPSTGSAGPRWPRLQRLFRVVDRVVYWSDTALRLPGTSFRFGLDPIVGLLFPGAGDAVGGVVSLSVVLLALQYRIPVWVVGRMVVNLALDAAIGSIPLLGDAFDFGFRANQRNMELLRVHGGRNAAAPMPKRYWIAAGLLLFAACALVALPIVLSVWLISMWLGGKQ